MGKKDKTEKKTEAKRLFTMLLRSGGVAVRERLGALLLLGVVILAVLSLLHPEAPVLQSLLRPPRSSV
jgi:hypothetical protein